MSLKSLRWHASITLHILFQIEKDSSYTKAVGAAGLKVEEIIKINNALNIYEEQFAHGWDTRWIG